MAGTCFQCGSSQIDEVSATLTFAREGAMPICSLETRVALCLECGFAQCLVPQALLAELNRNTN